MNRSLRALIIILASPLARAQALTVQINQIIPETCGNSNGQVTMYVFGGVEPYTFSWSNGATTQDLSGIPGGTYVLTVTDNIGTVASSGNVIVDSYANLPYNQGGTYLVPDGLGGEMWGGACQGQCNGQMAMPFALYGGTPPFNVTWNAAGPIDLVGVTPELLPVYGGFCLWDPVTYTYTDAYGCSGWGAHTIIGVDSVPTIESVQGACAGGANGRVSIYCPMMIFVPAALRIYRDGALVASPGYPQPAQTIQVQSLIAGNYELRMNWYGACPMVVPFTIPALAVPCGTVSGTNFLDDDQDCAPDAGEVRMPYQVLNIQPVDEWVLTGPNGDFAFALPNGNYTLAHSAPGIVPLCPLPQPVPFSLNSDAIVIQLADSSTAPLDIAAYLGANAARPGFTTYHHATVRNLSAKLSGTVQATLTFDPVLQYVSASPVPASVLGNVITWDLLELTAFAEHHLSVQYTVPVPTPLGTVLGSSLSATCTNPDADLANNSAAITQTVTGSYDPNDKTARTSSAWSNELYLIDQDEWIDYTIRFQNTGTDTAFTVVITDTLSDALDMSNFLQGTASHPFSVSFKPGRVVEWAFPNILLPDSNVNEPSSHGLISFRIRPRSPLLAGTAIENIANIYFDFNPPVITEPSVLTAEFSTGAGEESPDQLHVFPVPTRDQLNVHSSTPLMRLSVMALDGRMVREEPIQGHVAVVILQGLPSGAYLIRATDASGNQWHHPFLIEHD